LNSGCKKGGDKSCTPVGDTVNKVKDSCIEYKCTQDGKFELVKAGSSIYSQCLHIVLYNVI